MVLLAMSAIWKVRKNYRPNNGQGFDQWCYAQLANAYCRANGKLGAGRELAGIVKDEGAAMLPENEIRMAAFDRAFFGLSPAQKNMLSVSCQHPRLQEKYISSHKSLNQESFENKLNDLKATLLVKCAWKGLPNDHGDVASSDRVPILHLVAGTLRPYAVTAYQAKLVHDPILRRYYLSCVSLQQALMTRLRDDPSAELRQGDGVSDQKRHRKRLVLIALVAVLLPLIYSSTKKDSYITKGVNKAVYSVVPEPSSISMLAVGLGSLLLRRSREPVKKPTR